MSADKLEKLRRQVSQLDAISTAPVVLQPLLEILRLPPEAIRFDKVVELVSYDGAIAAQCLRMANSPLFGCREVETTRAAIMALGLQRVRSMLFGLCMNRVLPQEKWVFEPVAFWRHSLGCALVTQRMAQRIGYADPEKAYLAGLLHDLGILVNSLLCTEDFRKCVERAAAARGPLHVYEAEILGFTHCDSGQLLAEHWHLPADLAQVVQCHHDLERLGAPSALVCLVHLSDLLCRVRYLGYGYDEVLGVELGADLAWQTLVKTHPSLSEMDVARFTMDIDGAMDQIVEIVDAVFGGGRQLQETRAVDSRTTNSGSTTISRG
jgi:HD-like signal output (HDOD) protein